MIRRGSCSKKLKIWLRIRTVRGRGRRKDSALCFSPGRSLGAPVCLSVCLSWRGGVRPEDWSKSASASALAFPTPLSSRPWRPEPDRVSGCKDVSLLSLFLSYFPPPGAGTSQTATETGRTGEGAQRLPRVLPGHLQSPAPGGAWAVRQPRQKGLSPEPGGGQPQGKSSSHV